MTFSTWKGQSRRSAGRFGCGLGSVQRPPAKLVPLPEVDGFRAWRQADTELANRCGLSHDDLADQPLRAWHDDGLTAAEAAEECLGNEGWPGEIA